jgi:hypothetical protein
VLVVVDACREGLRIGTKSLAVAPWSDRDRRIAADRKVVTLSSCAKGQVAHYHEADPGADDSEHYSLFTKALCDALDPTDPATRLIDVVERTTHGLGELTRRHNKQPPQTLWLRGETLATRRELTQVICNGSATGPAAGPSPWADAISRATKG